jgi:3,4-dihydroxy 2-butanone 4-phosphate synthase/GTP cyclohydrolase II
MHANLIRRTTTARVPTVVGTFQLSHYIDTREGKEHLALVMGAVAQQRSVLTRVHSECFTGDVLGSLRCDCGEQLQQAMRLIAQVGQGVILYLRQEGRGIGLEHKLKAYNLQDQGYDTVDANLLLGHQADEREYSAAAAILNDLGITSIRLMTNNPAKIDQLEKLGIDIDERMPMPSTVTQDNAAYLATKIQRMRHLLALPLHSNGHSHHEPISPVGTQLATLADKVYGPA